LGASLPIRGVRTRGHFIRNDGSAAPRLGVERDLGAAVRVGNERSLHERSVWINASGETLTRPRKGQSSAIISTPASIPGHGHCGLRMCHGGALIRQIFAVIINIATAAACHARLYANFPLEVRIKPHENGNP
jgi:hypothetical protein